MQTGATGVRNKELLERFWTALKRGDRDTLASVFAEDAVWHVPPYYVLVSGREDARGRDAIVRLLLANPAEFYRVATIRLEETFLIADERFGAIQFTNRAKTVQGGDYYNLYVFAFRFEKGRVAEAWEHLDSAYFNRQIHGRE